MPCTAQDGGGGGGPGCGGAGGTTCFATAPGICFPGRDRVLDDDCVEDPRDLERDLCPGGPLPLPPDHLATFGAGAACATGAAGPETAAADVAVPGCCPPLFDNRAVGLSAVAGAAGASPAPGTECCADAVTAWFSGAATVGARAAGDACAAGSGPVARVWATPKLPGVVPAAETTLPEPVPLLTLTAALTCAGPTGLGSGEKPGWFNAKFGGGTRLEGLDPELPTAGRNGPGPGARTKVGGPWAKPPGNGMRWGGPGSAPPMPGAPFTGARAKPGGLATKEPGWEVKLTGTGAKLGRPGGNCVAL
mmetsp:Transcript_46135/g.121888  ORF Transcript_46135/g.121888 Transcript_46135/m.121888 type:complete len:306 (-) Transcript_46135:802-1719(-)